MTTHPFVRRVAALTICATALASCGGDGPPTAPSGSAPWAGVWQGTLDDTGGTSGTLRLTIEERPLDPRRSLISGRWTASFLDASRDGAGTFAGTTTDATGALLLTPAVPTPCEQVVLGPAGGYSLPRLTLAGRAIQGPFSQLLCAGTRTGTVTLTKQ